MARTVTTEADRDSAPSPGPERASSRSAYSRLPLGTKILIPFFAMTLCTALVAGIFFTSIEVAKDRAVQADAGKATAVMVRGALVPMPDDPSSIRAFLRSVVAAYPKVAALCVLTADHGNPLGPLVVYASAGEATGCDASSPLVPVLGTPGVVSGPRQTTAGAVEESVAGASLSSFGETAVVVVQVRLTPTADLAVPLFRDSAAAGILLGVVQTLLVYSVLKTWALRPLRQLRLKASATARAARPIGIDRFTAAIMAGDEIHDLSLRFEEMLVALRDREVEILETHDKLETLISNSPVLVFSTDREGTLLQVEGNQVGSMGKHLGHSSIVGVSLLQLVQRNVEFTEVIRKALAGEKVHEVVAVRNWMSDSETAGLLHLDVLMTPTRDSDGRMSGITGLAVNISDRMEAASARAESKQKSAFLAAMSHELRTPLNSIMGFSQLLTLPGSRAALTAKQRRYVEHIFSSGEHLLALVSDILDVAKVGAGQMEVNLEPVAIHEAITDPIDKMRPLAAGKGLTIRVEVPSELTALTDRLRLRQILLNLLTNAVKFSEPKDQPILVSGRISRDGVELAVSDSGIGIALEDQARIFEEFTQVDGGPSRRLDGTGLGLALTKRMVELVGGTVRVESALGSGSTFTVWLPGAVPAVDPPQLAASLAG